MACRWRTDKKTGLRYHVPECWGTVHDPNGECTCHDRGLTRNDDLKRQVMALTGAVAALTERVGRLEATSEQEPQLRPRNQPI